MKKLIAISLLFVGGIVLSALIFGAGMMVARANWGESGLTMMGQASGSSPQNYSMMGNFLNNTAGNGMMGGTRPGVSPNAKPLTVDQAKKAVSSYLKGLNNPDLELKEIMIFDNNAYARVTEKSTGIGAMELLVDSSNLSVFPEYGPNMMWNLKYGPMSGSGGMMGDGGMMSSRARMMNGLSANPDSISAAMTVSANQAIKNAQAYLDKQFPGYKAATTPDPFYGYYTIDILKDGKPTGMLSVNGYSGQVFFHTWHGAFIESFE